MNQPMAGWLRDYYRIIGYFRGYFNSSNVEHANRVDTLRAYGVRESSSPKFFPIPSVFYPQTQAQKHELLTQRFPDKI